MHVYLHSASNRPSASNLATCQNDWPVRTAQSQTQGQQDAGRQHAWARMAHHTRTETIPLPAVSYQSRPAGLGPPIILPVELEGGHQQQRERTGKRCFFFFLGSSGRRRAAPAKGDPTAAEREIREES